MGQWQFRIDLFQNINSQYGVLHHFTYALQKALQRHHIQSRVHDFQTQSLEEIIAHLRKDKPDFTFGFNVFLGSNKETFSSLFGRGFIVCVVDAVTHYPEIFSDANEKVYPCFVDENSVQLFQELSGKKSFYLPHAVDREYLQRSISGKRIYDVVLPGTFIDPDEIKLLWKEMFAKKTIQLLEDTIDNVLASPTLSHLTAFRTLFRSHREIGEAIQAKGVTEFEAMNS